PETEWPPTVVDWYGKTQRVVELASGTAVWYHSGKPPVSIRWVLIRDPRAQFDPQALLCTDLTVSAQQIVEWFIQRWPLEVTLQEGRAHLGLETQRQWNDWAILRTTPALLGLFSLVTLCAHQLLQGADLPPRQAAWYTKERSTFSDTLAFVRAHLWPTTLFSMSPSDPDIVKIPNPESL
ncbi:MAG: IS701 family transposase, partial [Candidatus Binatia bacterium]